MIESSKNMKKDEAVSPVIGVMLMLVVTVIIAAVVAGFGTGLIGGLDPAPSLSATAQITSDQNLSIIINGIDNALVSDDIEIAVTHLGHDDYWVQKLIFDGPVITSAKITTPIALISTNSSQVMTVRNTEAISNNVGANNYNYLQKLKSPYCKGIEGLTINKNIRLPSGSKLDIVMTHVPSGKAVFTKEIVFVDLYQTPEGA